MIPPQRSSIEIYIAQFNVTVSAENSKEVTVINKGKENIDFNRENNLTKWKVATVEYFCYFIFFYAKITIRKSLQTKQKKKKKVIACCKSTNVLL